MVEIVRLDNSIPYSFLGVVVVLFLIVYGTRRLQAVALLVALLLVLYFDFGDDKGGCENKTTADVCAFYRKSGACTSLGQVFEGDQEWAAYRFAVAQGLPASKTRLLNGYSVEYFPNCKDEVDEIRLRVEEYDGRSDMPKIVKTFETLFNPLYFLVLGFAGFFFSFITIGYRFFK